MSAAIEGRRLERLVGRLAASWRLRALTLEHAGVALASQCLRECAEELEAEMQQREPERTSWFRHEDAPLCGQCGHREACEAMGCKMTPNVHVQPRAERSEAK